MGYDVMIGLSLLNFYSNPTSESGIRSGIRLAAPPGFFIGVFSSVSIITFGRSKGWCGDKGALVPWADGLLTTAIGAALSYAITSIVSRSLFPAFVPEPVRRAFNIAGLVGSIGTAGIRAALFIVDGKNPVSLREE